MSVTPEFLREVQRAGWDLMSVDLGSALVSCPRQGCNLRVRLKSGTAIPETCGRGPDLRETVVRSYEDARIALRNKRHSLTLSIAEVEDIAGMASDHLAKAEKENPSRILTTNIFLEWCEALGFEVVLRPKELSPYALRVISQTRARSEARRNQIVRQRRLSLPAPD